MHVYVIVYICETTDMVIANSDRNDMMSGGFVSEATAPKVGAFQHHHTCDTRYTAPTDTQQQ